MFNVQVDADNFFTGSYATIGVVPNGVDVKTLPHAENSLCYKLVDVEVPVTYEEPIVQYVVYTQSDTEFDVDYSIKETDEDGNETYTYLTEEEYNALSEEEKANVSVTETPKMITVEITKDDYDNLSDDEKFNVEISYKTDENGYVLYETVEKIETVKDWEFSQERYDEIEAKRIADEEQSKADKEYQESISNEVLKAENQMLTEQIIMLDETMTIMLEEILPSLIGE